MTNTEYFVIVLNRLLALFCNGFAKYIALFTRRCEHVPEVWQMGQFASVLDQLIDFLLFSITNTVSRVIERKSNFYYYFITIETKYKKTKTNYMFSEIKFSCM